MQRRDARAIILIELMRFHHTGDLQNQTTLDTRRATVVRSVQPVDTVANKRMINWTRMSIVFTLPRIHTQSYYDSNGVDQNFSQT